jgi:hypothetical protein
MRHYVKRILNLTGDYTVQFFAIAILLALVSCGGSSNNDNDIKPLETPVLTLIGDAQIVVELNDIYDDAGATAIDTVGNDISTSITSTGTVDVTNPGTYNITYNVTDAEGMMASPIERTVQVVEPLEIVVNTNLSLDLTEVDDPDGGLPRPVGAIESFGQKAHLVQNEILIATDDVSVVNAFIDRWPAELKDTVAMEGAPDLYTLSINPADVSSDTLENHIDEISGISFGTIMFSSNDILKLYAIVAQEIAQNDLTISLNWVTAPQTIRSGTTTEQTNSADSNYTPDAFQWPYMNRIGEQKNGITAAWQTLDLLDIEGAERIMVIDSGFVDIGDYAEARVPAGAGWGSPSGAGCSGDSCLWHGTDVAHVALGVPDNGIGVAGSAGAYGILEPVQFTGFDLRGLGRIFGILLSAPVNGPPAVVNISGSVAIPPPFNVGLNRFLDPLFDRGLDLGILVVAAAGNDGENVDDSFRFFFRTIESSTVIPCETSSVICVGGLGWDSNQIAAGSNYGSEAEADSVDIYAPYQFWVPEISAAGVDQNAVRLKSGTSFSAPFVSGVLAMMQVANPALSAEGAISCLLNSAHQNDGVRIHSRGGNQRRLDAFEAVVCALGRRASFPLLAIDSPADGQTTRGRADVILNAASMGSEGLPLIIQWNSSIDGDLGTYTPASDTVFRDLSIGTHDLTATVTDANGDTATQSVSVTITNNPPTASILSPQEGETFGEAQSINLRALAQDIDVFPSGQLSGSQIRWSVTGNGFTTTGSNTSIPAGRLGIGTYTLTLVADDGEDLVEESVNFSVTECTGSCPSASITTPGDSVFRTNTRDDQDRIYVDISFSGVGMDAEDGNFAGRVNDGPISWTSVNEDGNVSNICTPFRLEPPLVPSVQEQTCDTFTTRYYLNEDSSSTNQHIVTMQVIDNDGNRATDSIVITIEFALL